MVRSRATLARAVLLSAALLSAALALPSATAAAGGEPGIDPEALRLYEQGRAQYARGELDAALASLEASYAITPAPGLLYDMAQVHRLNGSCAAALARYRRFLESGPPAVARDLAEARVTEMEHCLAAQAPRPAAPRLPDAAPVSPLSPLVPSSAPPAPVPAIMTPPVGMNAKAIAIQAPSRAPLPRLIRTRRRAAIAWASVGIALSAATGYFAFETARASAEVSDAFRPGATWGPGAMAAEQRGRLDGDLEIATAVGALAALGIAGWLALHD